MPDASVSLLKQVALFSGLSDKELAAIATLLRERTFSAGTEVVTEGQGGAGFFIVESGTARVTRGGKEVARLGPGDHFGEIALIDAGERLATVTATTDLVCHGLTYWEFRPLVQENGAIGWKLLQSMAKMLRDAQPPPE
ncbi:MAG: cyclic nucleotide-binding domain-containing protein [Actinomycetes bacterium]